MNIAQMSGLLALAVNCLAAPASHGQDIECGSADAFCLQRYTEIACREKLSSRATCEAWLHKLEAHPDASEIEWRIAAGWAYMSLADFATLTVLKNFGSVTEEEAAGFRAHASALFNDAVIDAPDNPNALHSLAVITEDLQTRMELLKRVVAADPTNHIAAGGLANDLVSLKGAAGYIEAAEILVTAYSHMTAIPWKWSLAKQALDWYELGGSPKKRGTFKATIASGIKFHDAEDIFKSLTNADEKVNLIAPICDRSIIFIFDGDACLRLIQLGQDDLVAKTTDHNVRYAEGMALLMADARPTYEWLNNQDISETFKSNIAALISGGYESAMLYATYANFLTGTEVQEALEKAVILAADAGEIRYRLGSVYLAQGMRARAIEQFEIALDDLPEWRHAMLEQQIKLAKEQLRLTPEP